MEGVEKIFNNWLFRVMSTWFGNYIQHKVNTYFDEAQKRYSGVVYLTQAEYDALSEEEKMREDRTYFIEEEE